MLTITAGGFTFSARLEEEDAPQTVAAVRRTTGATIERSRDGGYRIAAGPFTVADTIAALPTASAASGHWCNKCMGVGSCGEEAERRAAKRTAKRTAERAAEAAHADEIAKVAIWAEAVAKAAGVTMQLPRPLLG